MPSLLTRRVFRRLIANQPIVRHRKSAQPTRPQLSNRNGRSSLPIVPHRTFFGLFQKTQRDLRKPLLDPGMEKMLELDKRLHLVARLPPTPQLVVAFRDFVEDKIRSRRPIEDSHAIQLLQTLKNIDERDGVQSDKEASQSSDSLLTANDLLAVLRALNTKSAKSEPHVQLLRTAWKILLRINTNVIDLPPTVNEESVDPSLQAQADNLDSSALAKDETPDSALPAQQRFEIPVGYVRVLCQTGHTAEARDTLEVRLTLPGATTMLSEELLRERQAQIKLWSFVLAGFAKEDKETELLRTRDRMLSKFSDHGRNSLGRFGYQIIALYYARKDDVTETKKWFTLPELRLQLGTPQDRPSDSDLPGDSTTFRELLEFCLRNGEMKWGHTFLQSISDPEDKASEAILWASAATGKGVDEIDRMLAVMARNAHAADKRGKVPSARILNGLVSVAVSKNDPYTAERCFGLFEKWSIPPDAKTYILQMEYRLLANDLDGANATYANLRELPPGIRLSLAEADLRIINKLLRSIIAQSDPPHELIMTLVEDLSERNQLFPADTVLSLCTYHLDRDEYFEVVDLLQTYAYQYSTSDRVRIRDHLTEYTLAPSTDTGRAWDTYMVLHQILDTETRRDVRNRVMAFFFSRARPDLATHVFTRMNQHMRADTRPDEETYTLAFEGIAQTSEPEALEVIHNLLKLDTEVEHSTKIYNALMLAYSSCGMPIRALDFWSQIAMSEEGPSYESLHIAFRACERAPFGHRQASAIWDELRQADIEITRDLFASYAACLSGQSLLKQCFETLERMKEICGHDVDFFTLGSVYNASNNILHQERMVNLFQEKYPKVWKQVEEIGRDEDETGLLKIRGIDRSLKA